MNEITVRLDTLRVRPGELLVLRFRKSLTDLERQALESLPNPVKDRLLVLVSDDVQLAVIEKAPAKSGAHQQEDDRG